MEFEISPKDYRKAIEPFIDEQNKILIREMNFPVTMKVDYPKLGSSLDDDWDEEGILTFSVERRNAKFTDFIIPCLSISLLRFTYEIKVNENGGFDPGNEILKRQFKEAASNLKASLIGAKKQNETIANVFYNPHTALLRLIPCLCYTERNREFLAAHPHRELVDLSVYYRVMFTPRQMDSFQDDFPNSVGGIAVSNGMLAEWKKTAHFESLAEESLYQRARENAIRDSKSDICRLGNRNFLLLTNEQGYYGSAFAFTGLTEREVKAFTGEYDCLILPLSVHEVLIYPAGKDDVKEVVEAFHKYMGDNIELIRKPFLPENVYQLNSRTGDISVLSWGNTSREQAEGVITESDVLLARQRKEDDGGDQMAKSKGLHAP